MSLHILYTYKNDLLGYAQFMSESLSIASDENELSVSDIASKCIWSTLDRPGNNNIFKLFVKSYIFN